MAVVEDIFQAIVDGSVIEQAVLDVLQKWFPTYLQEIELQREMERNKIPDPRSYERTSEFNLPAESMPQLPAVIVTSPGLAGEPTKDGEGRYRARWLVGVAVVVSANTRENTNELAKVYAAAARAILLQQGDLEGFAAGTYWVDESYDDIPSELERTYGAGQVFVQVEVEDVVNQWAGPRFPTPPDETELPGSEWPVAETVLLDVERREDE